MSRDRPPYRDRRHAGAVLAEQLEGLPDRADVVVLALPRGGVPVAEPVAERLTAPLDVLVVRKVGVPGRPELAMGALARVGGEVEELRNDPVIAATGVTAAAFQRVVQSERAELDRRWEGYSAGGVAVGGRAVVVVDDGLATGSTMLAAVRVLRAQQPRQVVVAVPVAARQAVVLLEAEADLVVCPCVPEHFLAVGSAYVDFTQVPEAEVRRVLTRHREQT